MASLAGMLKQRGFRVTGSDAAAYPPMSDFLASLGIPVSQPFAAENLEPRPDLVVVGNAISRGNVELEHVLDERIPFLFAAADSARRISARKRSAGGRRYARENHDHLDALVDLSYRGPATVVPDWRHCGKLRQQLPARARESISSWKATNTIPPSSIKVRSSCTTFPTRDSHFGGVRSRGHLQRSRRRRNRFQTSGESGPAARTHHRLRHR